MKVPILKFKDLDEMLDFNLENQDMIHSKTFQLLKKEWSKNKKCVDLDLFEIYLTEDPDLTKVTLSIFSNEWLKALNLGLQHFEDKEDYTMCDKINKLLTTIETN
jgi:hypothetical protein